MKALWTEVRLNICVELLRLILWIVPSDSPEGLLLVVAIRDCCADLMQFKRAQA